MNQTQNPPQHKRAMDYRGNELCALAESLSARWRELCSKFLPIAAPDSQWRYSRNPQAGDLTQGWKLHLAAHLHTAGDVLGMIAPFLHRRGVMFKAPSTLDELGKINCGLYYGYNQVGKVFTVYPRSVEEARQIAGRLHKMTAGMKAPNVPFDQPYRD